ncbi:MAG: GNAT family N-acetyltransferase [Arenicellales bacterium]
MNIPLEQVTIRSDLRPGDLGYVVYLHGAFYGPAYGYGIEFETYVAAGIHEFYESYDPGKDRVWLCEYSNHIVGSLFLMHREDNSAQLRYFLVLPEYQGLGLGKRLMQLLMDFVAERGYGSVYLWTTHDLSAAASLYKRHGFELTRETQSTAFGKLLREQRYDVDIRSSG